MFRVGQNVVCVDASPNMGCAWTSDSPKRHAVYTVIGIGLSPISHSHQNLWLAEITNSGPIHPDAGFRATRFRPIVSRPTSIEFAHEILRSVSAPTKDRAHV